jgi:ATP-dependent DNA helicase RecG
LEEVTSEDLKFDLADGYREAVGASDLMRLLQVRGLAVDDKLTNAGALLFGASPQAVLPEAYVRVLRYRGRERGAGERQQLIDDIRIEGAIPEQLLNAQAQIRELQPVRQALQVDTGRFGPVPLVPEEAWLEGLVNAVVHRSYSLAGDHIRVEIFDDRIEIWSPGRFLGLVDLSDPSNVTRFARNPRIARVCADLRFGQELGEGIRRMFEEMRTAGLGDPVYRQASGGVQLTLLGEPVDRALDARLSDRGRTIMTLLRQGGRLSTGEIAEAVGGSRPTVQRELRELRNAGAISWVGKSARDPRAYWVIA